MPSGPPSSRSASPSRSVSSSRLGPDPPSIPNPNGLSGPRGDLVTIASLSSISNASSNPSSDAQFDAGTPPRLSLNHLKQGESHQRIRHGATQLLRLTENFSGYHGPGPEGGYETANDQALPSESDLRAMTKLSHGIARDISEIMALRRDDPGTQKRKAGSSVHHHAQHAGMGPPASHHSGVPDYVSTTGRGKNRRRVEFSCHKCHRVDTPEWRPGPDGPSTLCNVCGLIYAKRERKKEESTMPTFGSPNFS
ncbi:gata transcription factor [Colletotrichum plurivorum]|uniref:Gata transcription factor n=1 Tax=Colletotrichum plurivorum TaxID=2175906 RepID=A0A8H6N6E9_9PEZI|nr:gata transcription factor [Colletotrichum plurivorum]